MSNFAINVARELERARRVHPAPIHSAAEGYAVILEELDEFWTEVKRKPEQRSLSDMLAELVQVGAMAQRVAEDIGLVATPRTCCGERPVVFEMRPGEWAVHCRRCLDGVGPCETIEQAIEEWNAQGDDPAAGANAEHHARPEAKRKDVA